MTWQSALILIRKIVSGNIISIILYIPYSNVRANNFWFFVVTTSMIWVVSLRPEPLWQDYSDTRQRIHHSSSKARDQDAGPGVVISNKDTGMSIVCRRMVLLSRLCCLRAEAAWGRWLSSRKQRWRPRAAVFLVFTGRLLEELFMSELASLTRCWAPCGQQAKLTLLNNSH